LGQYFKSAVQDHLSSLYKDPIFVAAVGTERDGRSNKLSAREKLVNLKEMYDEDLITEDEYHRKREQIINAY
jgi:uncharacterized membrane protein